MRVIYWGTPQFAVPSLERLLQEPNIEVLGVVTQPDRRRGRGKEVSPSPVKSVAIAKGLPVWQPERIKQESLVWEELRSLNSDAFVVVAYGQILPPAILNMPRLGCINSHGSLLPKYRGAAPIQWALYHGETETGVTTLLMDRGMDTGDMLLKASIDIDLFDDAQDLALSLANISADLLLETLVKLNQQQLQPIPQEAALASKAPLLDKADFNLDWSNSAISLHNQIRAFTPYCQTQWQQAPLKIIAAAPLTLEDQPIPELERLIKSLVDLDIQSCEPGEVVQIARQKGPIVKTGNGLLLLRSLQLAGKRPQSGWDFANGLRLRVGEKFQPNPT
ncbi:MAG: methionyl-tRNA formyltransferase [Acaryochloridaceae cyanobacterium SU_2_1]|nr:methionyl-tRNA formyltransferase [Acaryochloridaceae cyanobacterium SU_2_1]